ncbi:hypothetical protein AKAW_00875 [Aspergillus luchuensis IFO 4308]|nr:hypothetical protein AKAW_00875 [Aspergillus luchuensis IFO 4308]
MRNERDKEIVTATSFLTDFEVNKEAETGPRNQNQKLEGPIWAGVPEHHPRGPAVPSDGRGEDVQGKQDDRRGMEGWKCRGFVEPWFTKSVVE